jgi:tRNA-dihydrouridine synthase B
MTETKKPNLVIRGLDLGLGIVFAPMAGVTDSPVRRLAKRFGADLLFSEMVPAKGLYAVKRPTAREKLLRYVRHSAEEKPLAVQLFGHEPETFTKAAKMALDEGAALIDINAGCPVKKVVNHRSGASLMRDPDLLARIVEATRQAGDFPLTVKTRLGWDTDSINYIEVSRRCIDAGADAITLHARTRSQMFGGQADWDAIKTLVEAVSVPVIGNGDITSGELAKQRMEQTGCAGIMIGRAAYGRPWIFAEVRAALSGQTPPAEITPLQAHQVFFDHFNMLVEEKGERVALREVRKHLLWYTKGYPGASTMRRTVYTFTEPRKVLEAAKSFFENAEKEKANHAEAC